MSATPIPAPIEPERGGNVGDVREGGWLIRITIIVIVLLWSIPTLGVLVTSFRAEEFVNTSGWWTALAHPFQLTEIPHLHRADGSFTNW